MPTQFEPYFDRCDWPGAKVDVGTGLGLSTAYGMINRWGGHIHVESHLGQGTLFVLNFLAQEETCAETSSNHVPVVSQRSSGRF